MLVLLIFFISLLSQQNLKTISSLDYRMKVNKQKWLIIVLSFLLVIAMVFIIVTQIQQYNQRKSIEIYQIGIQAGYETAIMQLMDQLATCQAVPVFSDNTTINVIAVECLQEVPPENNLE